MEQNHNPNLSGKVIRSGYWVLASRIVDQLLSKIRLIILARLLAPEDFGLMGIALLLLSALESFSETGFAAAIIQKKEDPEKYLDAAWTFLVGRGLVMAGIIYFLAAPAAAFFNAPQAQRIIQVIALSCLVKSCSNIGIVFFRKNLEFNRQFYYQLAMTLSDFVVAVTLAVILQSYWALVFGLLARHTAECIFSYLLHPYRPRLCFDSEKIQGLFRFGKWILLTNIVVFLATQGGDAFLGKMLGVTALGTYQMAFRFGNMVASEITGLVGRVTFPAYALMQNEQERLRQAYSRTLAFTGFLALPLTGMIVLLGPPLLIVLLGEKWKSIALPLQILALSGGVRALVGTAGPLFLAMGNSQLDFQLNLIRVAVLGLSIYPLTDRFGAPGTAAAVLCSISATVPYVYLALSRLGIVNWSVIRQALLSMVLPVSIMCFTIVVCEYIWTRYDFHQLLAVLLSAGISAAVYWASCAVTHQAGWQELRKTLQNSHAA